MEPTKTLTAPHQNPQIGHPKRKDVHAPKTGGRPGQAQVQAAGSVLGQRGIKIKAKKKMMTKM